MNSYGKYLFFVFLSFCILGSILYNFLYKFESVPTSKLTPKNLQTTPEQTRNEVSSSNASPLSNRIVSYDIDVQLNPGNILKGRETMTWTHPGKKTIKELYFHLYPNAFCSMNTTFMKESGGKLREDSMKKNSFGYIKLTSLKTDDQISLLSQITPIQPDDGNQKDNSLVKVVLPKRVSGGEKVTLHIEFEVKLPYIFARMGQVEDFVMAGQWFPKISAYEPQGRRGRVEEGWNLHQYHGNSEFYADFGSYNVKIRVPEKYIVAATGFLINKTGLKNGQKQYHFYGEDIHDFAWSASPHFIVMDEPFSCSNTPFVRIKLYVDPMHQHLKNRYFRAAKAALKNYSEWYGGYPYSTLSIVVPPKEANGAGGMEYPTLVTSLAAKHASPGYSLERTVIHEIAHQYFYGIIANNEFEEAWLDESFASYAEDKVMESEYGVFSNLPIQSAYIISPAPLTQNSWCYHSHRHYAENVYTRGKLLLRTIEKQVGVNTMKAIMKSYTSAHRFHYPTTTDFQKTIENITGTSWEQFFNVYVHKGNMADFSVECIDIKQKVRNGKKMYCSRVKVARKSGLYAKVPICIRFTDGHELKKKWEGTQKYCTYNLLYTHPVDWVMIDPQYSIAIENKHINNFLRSTIDELQKYRYLFSVTKWIESFVGSLAW